MLCKLLFGEALFYEMRRNSAHDSIRCHILRHNAAGRDNAPVSDMYARQNYDAVAYPYIILDINRLFILEALLHHRYIRSVKPVIPRNDSNIRAHHNKSAYVTFAVYFSVNTYAGKITECDFLREDRVFLHINLSTAICQH